MGLISLPGGLYVPPPRYHAPAVQSGGSTHRMNGAGQRFAFQIRTPRAGVLDKFEIRTHSASAVAAGSSIKFSFQDVNVATNPCEPDGTIDQFRDVAGSSFPSDSWIAPGLLTSDGTDGGTKRTVNKNELLALVLSYQTFTGGDDIQLAAVLGFVDNPTNAGIAHFPHHLWFSGSAWISSLTAGAFRSPLIALKYSDGLYSFISPETPPISSAVDAVFNNGSTPDERGARFRFPFPVRVRGAWLLRNHLSAGAYDIVLYDSDGSTPLDTVTIDPDQVIEIASNVEVLYVSFDHLIDLLANTYYRLVVKPTSVTDTRYLAAAASTVALMDGFPGGADWHATARTDAGAWSETSTEHPYMGLHLDGVEESASGGGGGGGGFVAVSRGFKRGMV